MAPPDVKLNTQEGPQQESTERVGGWEGFASVWTPRRGQSPATLPAARRSVATSAPAAPSPAGLQRAPRPPARPSPSARRASRQGPKRQPQARLTGGRPGLHALVHVEHDHLGDDDADAGLAVAAVTSTSRATASSRGHGIAVRTSLQLWRRPSHSGASAGPVRCRPVAAPRCSGLHTHLSLSSMTCLSLHSICTADSPTRGALTCEQAIAERAQSSRCEAGCDALLHVGKCTMLRARPNSAARTCARPGPRGGIQAFQAFLPPGYSARWG